LQKENSYDTIRINNKDASPNCIKGVIDMIQEASQKLKRIFSQHQVLNIKELIHFSKRSRASVFRDLNHLNYLSSYTHAGSYYTLEEIADFDQNGLWYHNEIGFSKNGNLKNTVSFLVEKAEDGKTHAELEALLRIRVHNTLLDLIKEGLLTRKKWQKIYLYLSSDPERAKKQLKCRQDRTSFRKKPITFDSQIVIQVLLEILNSCERRPKYITSRLQSKGIKVKAEEVEDIFEHYHLAKKN
jgi:hypothetical protein